MINDVTIRKVFYDWIKQFVDNGVTVIWENQGEQRPAKPYVSLHLLVGPTKRGHDDVEVLPDGATTVRGPRNISFSVNFLGQNAIGKMSRIQTSFELPSCSEYFNAEKMAFISDSGVRDLSNQLLENRFETRAQMDVRFLTTSELQDSDTAFVESVELVNDMDNSDTIINP